MLDDETVIEGRIVSNAETRILVKDNSKSYVIIDRDRVKSLKYDAGAGNLAFNLVALDQQLDKTELPTGGALISDGAGMLIGAIVVTMVGSIGSGLLAWKNQPSAGLVLGGLSGAGGLGLTFAGLGKISKGGKMLDAVVYE